MVNYKLYAWVVRGRQRIAVIKAMHKPQTPTQIRKRSTLYNERISLNNTSDVLRDFQRHGIAVCLNPDERVGRVYKLTDKGEKIRTALMEDE